MPDRWMLRGMEFGNCNCAYGCPCQFNAPTTHGFCEAAVSGNIEEGYFNDVRLDGLNWSLLLHWPGEIADGDGTEQAIIDERADEDQREALRKILYGESTAPGATHFYVYNSTMSNVFEPLYARIDLRIDVEARTAHVAIPGVLTAHGDPLIDPHSGAEHRARINLPNGFEYTIAEIGRGTTRTGAEAGVQLNLQNSYGQFNILHMNQDGVIR